MSGKPAWFIGEDRCPYSDLPILAKKSYEIGTPTFPYRLDLACLGKWILLVKTNGYCKDSYVDDELRLTYSYIETYFSQNRPFVLLEDYSDITGSAPEARDKYITTHKKNASLFLAFVIYNISLLSRFSFNLAKKFRLTSEPVFVARNYSDAVVLALRELCKAHPDNKELSRALDKISNRKTSKAKLADSLYEFIKGKRRRPDFQVPLVPFLSPAIAEIYSDLIIQYIASIEWDKPGTPSVPPNLPESDPNLQNIFNAFAYIKTEVDTIISKRDQTVKLLETSEKKFSRLIRHARAGIIEYDYKNRKIININDAALEIVGYSKQELLSKNLLDILSDNSRELFISRLERILKGEEISGNITYKAKTKDGRTRWLLLYTYVTKDSDNTPVKADTIVTDITRIKAGEEKLKREQKRLRSLAARLTEAEEKEKMELAASLHDGISQQLFAIYLKTKQLEPTLENPSHRGWLEDVNREIQTIIQDIRGLTYRLSPRVLWDLGLTEALHHLVDDFERRYGTPVDLRFDGKEESIPDITKTLIYRGADEFLENIARHSEADQAWMEVRYGGDSISLCVKDNGRGIPETMDVNSLFPEKIGLFHISQRVQHFGGKLTIHSEPGAGTMVLLEIPRVAYIST